MGITLQTSFAGETLGDQPLITNEEAKKIKDKEKQRKKEKPGLMNSLKEGVSKVLGEEKTMAAELPAPSINELWEFQKGLLDLMKEGQQLRADQLQVLQEAGENLAIVSKNQQDLYDSQKKEASERAKFYQDVQTQLSGASQARTINSIVGWGQTLFIIIAGSLAYLKASQVARDVQDIRRKQ